MSENASRLSFKIINIVDSRKGKELFDTLTELMNTLEIKNDPDMTEVCLVESLTQFVEKYQVMRHNLKSYSEGKTTLLGDKLNELYGE